jgi:glycosyltransferase involved in cell wall biosynthesis
MADSQINLLVWSGDPAQARRAVGERYPGSEVTEIPKRALRESGWKGQLRYMLRLRGQALIIYCASLDDVQAPRLFACVHFLHRCKETLVVDSSNRCKAYRVSTALLALPLLLLSLALDALVLATSWLALRLVLILRVSLEPVRLQSKDDLRLAYIYPYPLDRSSVGGAMSHVRGLLSGLSKVAAVEIYSGRPLDFDNIPIHVIPSRRRLFVFWESLMLSYNLRFAFSAWRSLRKNPPCAIYQRHRRFMLAGALLSKLLRVPLVLEYNSSERWTADHWDPSRFRAWLGMCEDVSLAAASRIVVVSEPLRQQLLASSVPDDRILVNPNGVDPNLFKPGSGRQQVREQLGTLPNEIVVGFVGSFSYWHGIEILRDAVLRLQTSDLRARLRFLLIGDGPLRVEMREALRAAEAEGTVIFTGIVAHDKVVSYLDACDILAATHLPMPDGKAFFGSPTKLFEYMAMGKAIVASDLDQLAEVLKHEHSALLVRPGDVDELVAALKRLASDPELRNRLGANARIAAVEEHTWLHNASRVVAALHGASPSTRLQTAVTRSSAA